MQNENGPCPLIAAANALLLRGAITLNSRAIGAQVIHIEELITTLANWTLSRLDTTNIIPSSLTRNTNAATQVETKAAAEDEPGVTEDDHHTSSIHFQHQMQQHHQHIDEVMKMLPNLQFGLDINPKFTSGPDSFEVSSIYGCINLFST